LKRCHIPGAFTSESAVSCAKCLHLLSSSVCKITSHSIRYRENNQTQKNQEKLKGKEKLWSF
jgi:hypothetical protein